MASKKSNLTSKFSGMGLLALLTMSPVSAFGQATQSGMPDGQPGEKIVVMQTSAEVITIGTTKAMVDLLLGTPRTGSTINCLRRSFYTYKDGSEIVLVDNRVISAVPNGLAVGSPGQGYTIQRENRLIYFDPIVVCGSPIPVPGSIGEKKRDVEECFLYPPPTLPVLLPPSVFSEAPCTSVGPIIGPINRLRLY